MEKAWYAFIAFVVAWLVAQSWKTIGGLVRDRKDIAKMDLATLIGYVTRSGGMPSGHTASLTAMLVCLGCLFGFNSGIFVLGVGVWLIVVYDATHVRYAVGEQGKALNNLLKKAGEQELPVVEGHTIPQVAVGAVIGLVVGLVVANIAFWSLEVNQPKVIFDPDCPMCDGQK